MKYKIEELKDITDSREILQSKPNGFSKYMMYIIMALLTVVIIWSLIAQKQVAVKASGVVMPKEDTSKIAAGFSGKVITNNLKEGMNVKKGDVLLVLDGEEYKLQKSSLEESLKTKEKELDANNKLKNSILDSTNYLNASDDVEANYSKMYDLYMKNIKDGNAQVDAVNIEKDNINKTISELKLLLKSYNDEKNYLDTSSYLYYQYTDYEMTLDNYRKQIDAYEGKIKELQDSKNNSQGNQGATIDEQIKELQDNIDSTNSEIEKSKNTAIMNVTNSIEQNQEKLDQSIASSSSGSYKEQYISQLDSTINSLNSSISEIKMNLDSVNNKVDEATIKAQYDGVVTLLNNIKVGDYIQEGSQIASVMPEDSSEYKAEIYIENQNFGEISEGENVILEFSSLPQSEYGVVKTKISNISVDAKVNEKGNNSFYTGECNIPVISLKDKNGKKVNIKNGMIVQARIVNRQVSYFRYFLEKVNILHE